MRVLVFALLTMATVAVAAQQTNIPAGLNFDSFKIIPDRNIFNQSRQPRERTIRPIHVADSFSLVGTLFYTGGDIAFFDGTSGDYRKALKVGGEIAGFKVTAVTLSSVTLANGTNQTVLKITTQMRRDDAGHWSVSSERASYGSAGNAAGSIPGSHSQRYGSSRDNFTTTTRSSGGNAGFGNSLAPGAEALPAPGTGVNPSATPPSGGANDALTRLMQRRAAQEKQLRQGQ